MEHADHSTTCQQTLAVSYQQNMHLLLRPSYVFYEGDVFFVVNFGVFRSYSNIGERISKQNMSMCDGHSRVQLVPSA